MSFDHRPTQTAIRTDLAAIFVSLELSRSVWLIPSLSPGPARRCRSMRCPPGISPAGIVNLMG
jgi:transposase